MLTRLASFFGKSLRRKLVLPIIGTLAVVLAIFAFYDIQMQRETQERVLLEKGKILALTGSQTVSSIFEDALASGKLTHDQLFDANYKQIPNTNPQRLTTAYDAFTDKVLLKIEDEFLKDQDITYTVVVDRNGYVPTHNTKFSSQDPNPAVNRTKRIFDDQVGITAARNTASVLQQVYKRDTGEVMWDLSAPVNVNGEHWGAIRVGFSMQRLQAHLAETSWRILLSVLGVMLVLALVVVFIADRTSGPLVAAARAAHLIANVDLANLARELSAAAQGDFNRKLKVITEEIDVKSNDEIGQMAQAFNLMVAKLKLTQDAFGQMMTGLHDLVASVAQGAASVAESSQQLARSTDEANGAVSQVATAVEQVAAGTTEQSKSLTVTSSNVESLTKAIDQIARGAQEQSTNVGIANEMVEKIASAVEEVSSNVKAVASAAGQAQRAAGDGVKVVDRSIQGMDAIKTTVLTSSKKVTELGEFSHQIGQIVQTIGEIADQTNLLALNAAIEAARAGENGRGFAVVADEVRKLAERSSQATKEIANLIGNVQKGTEEAVKSMEQGMTEVEVGSKLASEAGSSLQEIFQAVQATGQQFEKINAATEQMAGLSQEMIKAMQNVSSVVMENTAATEEMAAGSSEILTSIESVASVAEENSATTEEVSASVEEMTARVQEITATAQSLAQMADDLRKATERFKFEAENEGGVLLRRRKSDWAVPQVAKAEMPEAEANAVGKQALLHLTKE